MEQNVKQEEKAKMLQLRPHLRARKRKGKRVRQVPQCLFMDT